VTEEKTCPTQGKREDDQARVAERMTRIGHKIVVLSGKGGVGKSTVAVNLAAALRDAGKRTGLLDIDVHGPSVPTLLGLEGRPLGSASDGGIQPIESDGLRVMSIGFFIQGEGDAVIWRGPMKHGVIRQLLSDVDWGDLDYLVIDAPPGTGDEPLSVCQLLPDADGAIVVTTPQVISVRDVRRSVDFCRKINMRVLGVIENMSGFVCPKCGERVDIFKVGGGEKLALEMGVPFLGAIPLDPSVVEASDSGLPFVRGSVESETTKAFFSVVDVLLELGDVLRCGANPV
jgi:Mrp family chromosome partitioning ATPase